MVCAGTQTTLLPAARDLVPFAQSLGSLRLAAWYALELSTAVEAPFSTGAPLSQALLRQLEDAQVLRQTLGHEPGVRRALYEPLVWCYPTEWGDSIHLQLTLQSVLLKLVAQQDSLSQKLELWDALAKAEIETYLTHLLRRHSLDPASAPYIVHAMAEDWAGLSLARKRYIAWHATRGGAAALLRSAMDQDAARTAMVEEMRRRSRWLASRSVANTLAPEEYSFVPDAQWKRPILLSVFLSYLLPAGRSYWTDLPRQVWEDAQKNKAGR